MVKVWGSMSTNFGVQPAATTDPTTRMQVYAGKMIEPPALCSSSSLCKPSEALGNQVIVREFGMPAVDAGTGLDPPARARRIDATVRGLR